VTLDLPKYVEVETSRRCNRTCSWCPNGEHDARKVQQLMDWDLFTRIIEQLAEHDYGGYLAFHNYNEPLLSPRIIREIEHVRAVLPRARPAIYTNGDVLDSALFTRLLDAGVAYLRVTRYPRRADIQPTFAALQAYLRRKGLADLVPWSFEPARQGIAARWNDESVTVEVIGPKILDTYNNRGGSIKLLPLLVKQRSEPCLMTATSAVIDYAGRMKMCCCVYPETDDHEQYIVGDLSTETFAELWAGPQMKAWRDAHARADWSLSPACTSCTQPLPETRR
jgi:Radical SAM superfamily/Iron-sulfur cluster-binding domain